MSLFSNKTLDTWAWTMQFILIGLFIWSVISKLLDTGITSQLFEKVGLGAGGLYASAFIEIVCIILLITKPLVKQGALLAMVIFAIGLFFQVAEVGFFTAGDGGARFYSMVLGLLLSVLVYIIRVRLSEVLFKKGRLD